MKNLLFLSLILFSIFSNSQTFQETIEGDYNGDIADYGHYSIQPLDDESGYLLVGTKYDNGSSINSRIEAVIVNNSGVVVSTNEFTFQNYQNSRAYKLNREGAEGNFLITGCVNKNDSTRGLIIELENSISVTNPSFSVLRQKIFRQSETTNLVILDAEYIHDENNYTSLAEGYFFTGTAWEQNVLDNEVDKIPFYGFTNNDMNFNTVTGSLPPFTRKIPSCSTKYIYSGTVPRFNDEDQIHKVEYIPGIGALIGGSLTICDDNTGESTGDMLLRVIDLSTASKTWSLDTRLADSVANNEYIADWYYDSASDTLIVLFNSLEPTHSMGMLKVGSFSSTPVLSSVFSLYDVVDFVNVFGTRLLKHPTDQNKLIIYGMNVVEEYRSGSQPYLIDDVFPLVYEFDWNTMQDTDYYYIETPNYSWNTQYSYFQGAQGESPQRDYPNSVCISNVSNDNLVFCHYRKDNIATDLELMSYLISIDDSDNDCYYKRDVDSIPIAYVSKDQLGQESFSLHSFNDETYISATLYDEEELCGTDRNNYSSMASGLQYSIDFVECFTASFTFQGVTLGSGTVTSVKWLFPDGSSAVASPPGTTVYFTFDCDNLDDDIFIELTLSTGFTVVFNIGSIPWSFWSWNCEPCGNLGDGPFRLKSATNDFKLYPNPATNQIYYQSTFAEDELIDLEIFSVNGKMVFNGTTMPPNGKINIENLPSGVYIFRLRMNDSMEFRKFTIR